MTDDRWNRIEHLYHAARKRNTGERASFLDAACGGVSELLREVELLLKQDEKSIGLNQPIVNFNNEWGTASGAATRAPGSALGSYEIVDLIGVGGMGEVYRAHDAKLKRDVAIKILPFEFSCGPNRISR